MAYFLLLLALLLCGWCALKDQREPRISTRELAGLWRQTTGGPFVGYLYFTGDGAVYYMASRLPVTEGMFTEKFRIADSCSGCTFSSWEYTAQRDASGSLLLSISGRAISGTYCKIS